MANSKSRLESHKLQDALLDDPSFLKGIIERVLQDLLEAEMEAHIGAAPYERSKDRRGMRNGRNRGRSFLSFLYYYFSI